MSGDGERFDFRRLVRTSLFERQSLSELEQAASPPRAGTTFREFLDGLPKHLGARDLRVAAREIAASRRAARPVILAMGAHPVKVGLVPTIIELIKRRIITALAVNGAVLVHDYEMAACGRTSEDVAAALADGGFGVTLETGRDLARFLAEGDAERMGLAESIGRGIARMNPPHGEQSLLASAVALGTPVTAHVAIGTDVAHLAPELDFARLGAAAGLDFARFIKLVSDLEGGVFINLGSAVVMPEVFLKAVSAARNTGAVIDGITTVNMDFLRQYRPIANVVTRPTLRGGRGINLTGHHEIMLPLLAHAVLEEIEENP